MWILTIELLLFISSDDKVLNDDGYLLKKRVLVVRLSVVILCMTMLHFQILVLEGIL